MSIKTVGNQTFLTSPVNKLAINIAHIVKVVETEYYYWGGEEEIKQNDHCLAILTTDDRWTYIGDTAGWIEGDRISYKVYGDLSLVTSLLELYF